MTRTTTQVLAIAAIATASLLSAGAVFAQEATPDTWQQIQLTKTRAEVSAELFAARKSGLTKAWSAGYMEKLGQSALRSEVRAETMRAIEAGEVAAINGEASTYTPAAYRNTAHAGR